jgi:hypothetical protein
MFLRAKTAILIAVFLLFFLEGCYTKLKHPVPVINPDEPGVVESNEQLWDFSYGWYWSGWQRYSTHYGYYCRPWWYDCPWCFHNDLNGDENEVSYESLEKITRRDDGYTLQEGFHYQPSEDLTGRQPGFSQQQYSKASNQSYLKTSKSKNETKYKENVLKFERRGR